MKITTLLILLATLNFSAYAEKLNVDATKGKITFVAIGRPAMLRIKGEGPGPQGELNVENQKVSGTLVFDLNAMTTGIDMRDHHMKEKYLEVPKFPTAQLLLSELSAPTGTQSNIPFKGQLTLHGVQKPVSGTYDVTKDSAIYTVSAKFSVQLSDYKIDIPSYSGIKVADNVEVEVTFAVGK